MFNVAARPSILLSAYWRGPRHAPLHPPHGPCGHTDGARGVFRRRCTHHTSHGIEPASIVAMLQLDELALARHHHTMARAVVVPCTPSDGWMQYACVHNAHRCCGTCMTMSVCVLGCIPYYFFI